MGEGPANQSAVSSWPSDLSRDEHMTQAGPMRTDLRTFPRTPGGKALFLLGLQSWMNVSLELLAVNLATGKERDCLKMRLTQKKPEVLR